MAAREHFRLKNQVFVRRHGAPMSLLLNLPYLNLLAPLWLILQGYRLLQAKLLLDKKTSWPRLLAFCLGKTGVTLLWAAAIQSLLFALGYHFWAQGAQDLLNGLYRALLWLPSPKAWANGLSQCQQLHPLLPTHGYALQQILMHQWLSLSVAVALFLFLGFALASLLTRRGKRP